MRAQQTLLCLATAAAAALLPAASHAQRLGLTVQRSDFRLPCQTLSSTCEEVSVVGRAAIGSSAFSLTGKVGSTATLPRTYALGADPGFGLSYGAGVSWDFSPRASATLNWDMYDLRGSANGVRSTSLGLQWRY